MERSLKLSGVDLVDGTPVLDIKPYVPNYDCPCPQPLDPDRGSYRSAGAEDMSSVRVAVSV